MEQVFSNTAVFCANCGRKLNPEDKFCRECGSQQVQEVNIEPINVDKKMRLRAGELLPDIDRSVPYVAMASDGLPVRGMLDPRDLENPNYRPPVFVPTIKDLSIKHDGPVEIHSTEIDVFNFRCSYFASFDDAEKARWYPGGDYCFHLIRTTKGARCRIEYHSYGDNREEEFDADTFALTRLDTLLKERDVAQLDGYSVHSPGAANHMDLLVQYVGGERIAATGLPPHDNQYYNAEWFIDFFRSLSGAFGKNIFTDSFKERELAERQAAVEKWKRAVKNAADRTSGDTTAQGNNVTAQGNGNVAQKNQAAADGSWQCSACGQLNLGPFCSECGSVKPKE